MSEEHQAFGRCPLCGSGNLEVQFQGLMVKIKIGCHGCNAIFDIPTLSIEAGLKTFNTRPLEDELVTALEKVERIVSVNLGHQTEKLADVVPIVREALAKVKAQ